MPDGQYRSAWHWIRALPDLWRDEPATAPDKGWFAFGISTDAVDGDTYDYWRNKVYYDFSADRRADPHCRFRPGPQLLHARAANLFTLARQTCPAREPGPASPARRAAT